MKYLSQSITSFLDTNLTDTYNDWSAATTYSFESGTPTNASVVRYGTYYYRSLVNSNLNKNPEEYENVYWVKYGVSNKYAMLDLAANTKAVYNGGNLYATFLQDTITSLAIGNYEAETITIQSLDASNNVLWSYTTGSTVNIEVVDYYSYIYNGYQYEVNKAIKIDIPISGYKIKVTFNKSANATRTACGYLVGGSSVTMGQTLQNINFKFNSFAEKSVDDWGSLTITKRAVQDLVDFETIINRVDFVKFKREIKSVYNDIVVFILDEQDDSIFENLLVLGVIQDASVVLTEFDKITMTFSIMESV